MKIRPSQYQQQIDRKQGLEQTIKQERETFLHRIIAEKTAQIHQQPKDAAALHERGRYYARLDDHNRAVRDFSSSIRLDAKSYHHYKTENKPEFYKPMHKLKMSVAQTYQDRATSYQALEKEAEAIKDNKTAHSLNPAIALWTNQPSVKAPSPESKAQQIRAQQAEANGSYCAIM